jgi:2-polyprenyl-6-methoxyphenol hydroxylase-like FAD-dependent oxidoreductase
LRLGCPVVAIEENDETVAVVIRGGERIEAEVIVGADGKSTINSLHHMSSCIFQMFRSLLNIEELRETPF